MDEFERGHIPLVIGRDFVRVRDRSYPASEINDVNITSRQVGGLPAAVVCGLLTLVCAFSGRVVLAVILAGLTYVIWRRSRITWYQLVLITGSSEVQAASSRTRALIEEFREKIQRLIGEGAPTKNS
jgi:uncharacterized membrane protein